MRRGRSLWKVERGEGWRALEKVGFLCSLKDGEGQGTSRLTSLSDCLPAQPAECC